MTRKCHNHTLQTIPQLGEEDKQNTLSPMTSRRHSKQPALSRRSWVCSGFEVFVKFLTYNIGFRNEYSIYFIRAHDTLNPKRVRWRRTGSDGVEPELGQRSWYLSITSAWNKSFIFLTYKLDKLD